MHKVLILAAFAVFTSVETQAEVPRFVEPSSPRDLASVLEARIVAGEGVVLPDANVPIVLDSGTIQGVGGVGGLLYLTVDGAIYIPCYDSNGNVTRYLDANGNTVAQYAYDAFGNLISKSGPLADFFRHRFSTKYCDTETGLYYYGYRYYSPSLMRWLNRDPIEEDGGENLYAFCENCPVYSIDFLGKISLSGFLDTSDGLGFLEGGILYYLGDGASVHVPVTKLGLPMNVNSYFDPCTYRKGNYSGNNGTFDTFRMTRISGWRQGGPGRVHWELKGDLRWEDNHKRCWTFSGNVKVSPDLFDFNPRPKRERGSVKEGITRAVNMTGAGTRFLVVFDGTLEIKGKGSCR